MIRTLSCLILFWLQYYISHFFLFFYWWHSGHFLYLLCLRHERESRLAKQLAEVKQGIFRLLSVDSDEQSIGNFQAFTYLFYLFFLIWLFVFHSCIFSIHQSFHLFFSRIFIIYTLVICLFFLYLYFHFLSFPIFMSSLVYISIFFSIVLNYSCIIYS